MIGTFGCTDDVSGSGLTYDYYNITEENIQLEIKEKPEIQLENQTYIGTNYVYELIIPFFVLLNDGELNTYEADYVNFIRSSDSVQFFEQGNAYSIYEIDPASIVPLVPTTPVNPEISIHSPYEGETFNSSYFFFSVSTAELSDIWYNIDGVLNSTKVLNTTSLETLAGPVYVEGSHTLNVYAAETATGNVTYSTVDFNIDLPEKTTMADYLGFDDSSARAGDIVTIPLEIANVTSGPIQTIKVILDYDENVLQLESLENTSITSGWQYSLGTDNRSLTMTTLDQSNAIPIDYSGSIWNLNFRVIGTPGETSVVTPVYIDFSNTSNEHGTATPKSSLFIVESTGTLSGNVVYNYNETIAIENVTVTLYNTSGYPVDTVMTDSSGNYVFENVEPGSYIIGFGKSGFYIEETIAVVSAVEDSYADMALVIKGDLDNNGLAADAVDINMIMQASVGDYPVNEYFDLDENSDFADAVDVNMMIQANVGDIELE
jgi:hypothetical protein